MKLSPLAKILKGFFYGKGPDKKIKKQHFIEFSG